MNEEEPELVEPKGLNFPLVQSFDPEKDTIMKFEFVKGAGAVVIIDEGKEILRIEDGQTVVKDENKITKAVELFWATMVEYLPCHRCAKQTKTTEVE